MAVDLVLQCGFFCGQGHDFLFIDHLLFSHQTKNIFEQPLLLRVINVCLE